MRDFLNILKEHNYYHDKAWNRTDSIYTFETGSTIEFFSVDQPDKLRGARRDRLFINEANNTPMEAFDQLEVRTKEFVFLDWNPSSEFWFYTDILPHRTDVDFITLTYRDNDALSPEIIASIEARKHNVNWWRVYGEGQLGEVEGRIYTGWRIIDEIPHEAKLVRRWLDFGYSCLVGETSVETSSGEKRLDQIKVGDYVLTRKGYRKVTAVFDRGIREVFELDFGYNGRIIGTGDHRIYTEEGWKPIEDLSNQETLCLIPSFFKETHTKDTRKESTQTTFFQQALRKQDCIGIFTSSTMERSLLVFIYTTKTITRSIMTSATFVPCLLASISRYITKKVSDLRPWIKRQNANTRENMVFQKQTGKSEEISHSLLLEKESNNVLSAVKTFLQQIYTKFIAVHFAINDTTQNENKKNTGVKCAEQSLLHRATTKEHHALKRVPICLKQLKEKRRVFDITVEDAKEFFANGVLVHNCDPTAIGDIYYLDGGYILDERMYQKGMLNKSIADFLLSLEEPATTVVGDSAEPKSIDEIYGYGVNIIPCVKGRDSIRNGIATVQEQKISVTKRSLNLLKEYRNYMWDKDKQGRTIPEPIDFLNNHMDGLRYGITSLKGESNPVEQIRQSILNIKHEREYIDHTTSRYGLTN